MQALEGRRLLSLSAPTLDDVWTISTTEVAVKWADINSAEQGYRVERRTTGTSYATVATLPADSTSYEDSNLTPLTVTVADEPGQPDKSRLTYSGGVVNPPASAAVDPDNWVLQLFTVQNGKIVSGSTIGTPGVAGSAFSGSFLVDKGAGDRQYVALYASEYSGSVPSNVVTVPAKAQTPAAPTGLTATLADRNRKIRYVWNNSSTREAKYVLQVAADPNFTTRLQSFDVSADNPSKVYEVRDDTGRSDVGVILYARVKAVGSGGDSAWSVYATNDGGPIYVGFRGAHIPPNLGQGNEWIDSFIHQNLVDSGNAAALFDSTAENAAFSWLRASLDLNGDGKYEPDNGDQFRTIRLYGHSWGGTTATSLSRKVFTSGSFVGNGKFIDRVALIDPVRFGRFAKLEIWANVSRVKNWYQRTSRSGQAVTNILGVTVRGQALEGSDAYYTSEVNVTALNDPTIGDPDHFEIINKVYPLVLSFLKGDQ